MYIHEFTLSLIPTQTCRVHSFFSHSVFVTPFSNPKGPLSFIYALNLLEFQKVASEFFIYISSIFGESLPNPIRTKYLFRVLFVFSLGAYALSTIFKSYLSYWLYFFSPLSVFMLFI